jgi:hypothetical protein
MEFAEMWKPDVLYPGPSVGSKVLLSTYHPGLRGTHADTDVYLLESGVPGATVLLLGGTHPNESAGFLSAVLLVEQARMTSGRLIVIPQACASGFTGTDPLEGAPQSFSIMLKDGSARSFRFGARAANPVDQWPDPLVFLQYPSGQQLSGNETRNLNRAYPGKASGTLTEQTAYAIMQLIGKEHVDVAIDLHEAAPEIPIINAIVTHPKSQEIAASAVLGLEFEGLQYALELSPDNFRGLSHREWGERTGASPFLMETSNPIQGRLRGATNEELIVKGIEPKYARAAALGKMRITYEPTGEPIELRVARHVQGLRAILEAWGESHPDNAVSFTGIPVYNEILEAGLGAFLRSSEYTHTTVHDTSGKHSQ